MCCSLGVYATPAKAAARPWRHQHIHMGNATRVVADMSMCNLVPQISQPVNGAQPVNGRRRP